MQAAVPLNTVSSRSGYGRLRDSTYLHVSNWGACQLFGDILRESFHKRSDVDVYSDR